MIDLAHVFQRFKNTIVRITVKNRDGDLITGTAFHIGDGWLVTARHIIEAGEIEALVPEACSLELSTDGVLMPSDANVDLALVKTNFYLGLDAINHIEIGGHLDDWLNDEFVLKKVLVIGYPRIPLTRNAVIVASEGEINSIVDKYNEPHAHFIISTMARGGFSGSPVLGVLGGEALLFGVVTQSLVENSAPAELGFSSAVSVEPLLNLLHEHRIYPGSNREILEKLYD